MQGTGRRSAPSLFCPFATHRTVHQALLRTVHRALLRTVHRDLFRTACQALLRTAWRPPAPAPPSSPHRRLRRSRVVRIIATHRCSLLTARRPHLRPHLQSTPPSASSSAARHQPAAFPSTPSPVPAAARACRCPAAFLRTSGVRFAHVTQQMYAHLFNMLKINMLQLRQKKTTS